jgi:hypothetical protein
MSNIDKKVERLYNKIANIKMELIEKIKSEKDRELLGTYFEGYDAKSIIKVGDKLQIGRKKLDPRELTLEHIICSHWYL